MGIITFLIIVTIQGLVLGALARLALPGPDPMSIGQTILVGAAGSILAGLIGYYVLGIYAGFLLAFTCTLGIVYAIRRHRGGTLTRPAAPRGRLRR